MQGQTGVEVACDGRKRLGPHCKARLRSCFFHVTPVLFRKDLFYCNCNWYHNDMVAGMYSFRFHTLLAGMPNA